MRDEERGGLMDYYLEKELFDRIKTDRMIFDFLQEGSLDGLWYLDLTDGENIWLSPKLWTTLGYGPRFLHSTGQLHKGGPATGLFIQLTADHPVDRPIPGWPYTFGQLIDAQAEGDFQTLEAHERRTVRIHLDRDVDPVSALRALFEEALA
jgi:hypothetical protein